VRELKGSIPSIEGTSTCESVDESMEGGEEEVESQGDEGYVREIAKVRVNVSGRRYTETSIRDNREDSCLRKKLGLEGETTGGGVIPV